MPLPSRLPAPAVSVPHVFYLHGFASSPRSTKVRYFSERLAGHGVVVHCPDFNEPDFGTLTISRMLEQLGGEISGLAPGSVALMGSSLGGALAILAAARFPTQVNRLVLMAPAVMFAKPGHHLLPPERIDEWRRRGTLPFFHYAYDEPRDLRFEFYEDSLSHDPFDVQFHQSTLVFQGVHDASVDYRTVEAFAKTRSNVVLSLLDDDHQLIASLPRMWEDIAPFLGIGE